jgi:transcription initiation factor TFIIIB Brf1 subunit/transcription initiation factor TFIIB
MTDNDTEESSPVVKQDNTNEGTPEQRSQIDVANAANVTDITIRNRFKDLKNRLG